MDPKGFIPYVRVGPTPVSGALPAATQYLPMRADTNGIPISRLVNATGNPYISATPQGAGGITEAELTGQALAVIALPFLFDRLGDFAVDTYFRQELLVDDQGGAAGIAKLAGVVSRTQLFNGTGFNPQRTASATVHADAEKFGITAVAMIGGWTITSDPAANAQATATQAAAGAGARHILTSICATFSAGATAGAVRKVYVRDGATGVGAILWSGNIAVPVGDSRNITLGGLAIVGSPATAMTVEFDAAGGLTTQENISATGYAAGPTV